MRRFLVLVALVSALGSLAVASPLCVNNGTLQSYITNNATLANACQIGDKLFWGFNLTTGALNTPGAGPLASSIQVQPVPGNGLTNVGISFNSGGWAVSNRIVVDSNLSFNVGTISGAPTIEDASLIITGNRAGTSGSASVTETLNPAVNASLLAASFPGASSAHSDFSPSPVSTLAVNNHILLLGGARFADLAHISVIENDFSKLTVPEPLVTLLIGSGLLLLGVLGKRFNLIPGGGKN